MNATVLNVAAGQQRAGAGALHSGWEFSSIPEQWRKKWRQDGEQHPLKLHWCSLTPEDTCQTCSQRSSLDLRCSADRNEAFLSIVGVNSPEQRCAGRAEQCRHPAAMKVHDNEDRSESSASNVSEWITAALWSAFVLQKRLFWNKAEIQLQVRDRREPGLDYPTFGSKGWNHRHFRGFVYRKKMLK